jgi:hypothetical protein
VGVNDALASGAAAGAGAEVVLPASVLTALGLLLQEGARSPLQPLGQQWFEELVQGRLDLDRALKGTGNGNGSQQRLPRRHEAFDQLPPGVESVPLAPRVEQMAAQLHELDERLTELRLQLEQPSLEPQNFGGAAKARDLRLQLMRLELQAEEAVAASAAERLVLLEKALAEAAPEQRWPLFMSQVERTSVAVQSLDGSRVPAAFRALDWPEAEWLGFGLTTWAWVLGLTQLLADDGYVVSQGEVLEQLCGTLEARAQVLLVEDAIRQGTRSGLMGLAWLANQLYGPAGLWSVTPTLRPPLWLRFPGAVACYEQLLEQHNVAAEALGVPPVVGPFQMTDRRSSVWERPDQAALAVGLAAVARQWLDLAPTPLGYGPKQPQAQAYQSWETALAEAEESTAQGALRLGWKAIECCDHGRGATLAEQLGEKQQAVLGALAAVAPKRQLPDELLSFSLSPRFAVGVTPELVMSCASVVLRRAPALLVGRFAREPLLLRQELEAWMVSRLAAWDGLSAEAQQAQVQPLAPEVAAALGGPGPAARECKVWLLPLGLAQPGDEPVAALPQLSESQRLDWRVQEVLRPLVSAVLAELFQQLQQALRPLEAAFRERQARDWDASLAEAQAADAAAKAQAEAGEEDEELELSPFQQLLLRDPEAAKASAELNLELAVLCGGLAAKQSLTLQAPWVREALGVQQGPGLRQYLLELGRVQAKVAGTRTTSEDFAAQLAEQLHQSPEQLRAWEAAQPFTRAQARLLARELTAEALPLSRFGSLAETLLDEEAHEFAPCWLQRQLVEES